MISLELSFSVYRCEMSSLILNVCKLLFFDIRGDFDFDLLLLIDFFLSECKNDLGEGTSFYLHFFDFDFDLDFEFIFE